MAPTRAGRIVLGLALLTWLAATASGNNLLYLLYSLLVGALGASALALALSLRGVSGRTGFPDQVFRGTPFGLVVRLRNSGALPAYGLRLRWGAAASAPVRRLGPGEEAEVELPALLPHRGLNRLEGLRLESSFPLGLLRRSLPVEADGLAFPRPREVRSSRELVDVGLSETGTLKPRKGGGEEFYGIRPHEPSDGSRMVNWKLSARTGSLMVNEFASTTGGRVAVRVEASAGEAAERGISEAASACRFYTDKGLEIRLETPEGTVDFGKGLPHLDRLLTALALLGPGRLPRPAGPPPTGLGRPAGAVPPELLRWTYAGSALVAASLPLIEDIQPWLLAAAAAALAAAWLADLARTKGRRLRGLSSDLFWRPASVAMLVYVLLFGWRLTGVTLANTHLLMYMLAYLLLREKGPREVGQLFVVLFLAFFLISGQTISLWYFLSFILYSMFVLAWLALAEGGRPGPRPVALVLAATLALAGTAFAATPRIEPLRRMNPFVAMGLDRRAPSRGFVTGFTEDVTLGFFGTIKRSSARVLRLRPVVPRGYRGPLRVRGSAFDVFDGRRWRKRPLDFRYSVRGKPYRTMKGRAWTPRNRGELLLPGDDRREGATVTEVTVLPLNSPVLFTVDGAAAVEEPDSAVYFDYTDTLYFGAPQVAGSRYRVTGSPAAARGFSPYVDGYDGLVRKRCLQLPALDPRVLRLAAKAARGASDDRAKIAAVARFLSRGYSYSLYSDDSSRDLNDFLLSSRSGNCEYFATAAAVLLRASGVPARLVTGFVASEWNEYGDFYDVRQGDAHAWAEAYLDGEGWVPVDATPPGGILSMRSSALIARARRWFEALQARWYRDVVGYDKFVQRNTFLRFRLELASPEAAALWGRRLAASLLGGTAAALLLLGARALVRRASRPRGPWERVESRLARAGFPRRPWQTPREFAEAVARARPDLSAAAPLAEAHYELRWSGRPPDPRDLAGAEQLADELLSALTGL